MDMSRLFYIVPIVIIGFLLVFFASGSSPDKEARGGGKTTD